MTGKQPVITIPRIRFMQALQAAQDCQYQNTKRIVTIAACSIYVCLILITVLVSQILCHR